MTTTPGLSEQRALSVSDDAIRAMVQDAARDCAQSDKRSGRARWCAKHGVNRSHVNEFINGKRKPQPDMLTALGLKWAVVREDTAFAQPPASGVDREAVARQFERIKSVETALANGAHYADDPECHPCYPTLVASRQILEAEFAALTNSGAPVPGDADLREALEEVKTALPVLSTMLTAANLSMGSRRCMEMLVTVDAALAANPVPGDAGGAERICREAAQWELTQAATPGIGKKAADNHRGAAHALEMVADKIAAHAAPASGLGCHCTDICAAPFVMGYQTPCRRPGGVPGQPVPKAAAPAPSDGAGVPAGMVRAELEQTYGALRWIYVNGMQVERPQSVSDVINEAFASYRIAQPDMPAPRPEGTDTPKQATPTDEAVLGEARSLAVLLHAKHYPEVTQWEPLDDLRGIISQIDNMTTGLERARSAPGSGVGSSDA